MRAMNQATTLRRRNSALLLLVSLHFASCASMRPDAAQSKRDGKSVERNTAVPAVARGAAPAVTRQEAPPAPNRRVEVSWPVASFPGTLARPLSELARAPGAGAAAPGREVVRAIAIPFAAGATELDARGRALLDAFAARLNRNDARWLLEVQGHTDGEGSLAANIATGLRRAEAVRRDLLAATGIPRERIAVVSLGSGQPVADNSTAEGRAANRRVVVLAMR
jgi:hypothetical protein